MSFTTSKFEGIRAGKNPIKVNFITGYTETGAKVSYNILINGFSSEGSSTLSRGGSSAVDFKGLTGDLTMNPDNSITFNGNLNWAEMVETKMDCIIAIK